MFKKTLACLAAWMACHGAVSAQETIKIGLMPIDSGPQALYSMFAVNAAELAVDVLNARGGALGRKYELVTQAFAGTPAAAVAAATKLAQQQSAPFLIAVGNSAVSAALSPKLAGLNALFIDTSSAHEDLTGKNCQPNFFRVTPTDGTVINVLRSAVKQSGAKTWNMMMADYSAGHEFTKTFTAMTQELGGSVQTALFAPLTTTDFGSYISQLGAKPADGLAVFFFGGGGNALVKQQQQFGLFSKYKTVLTWYLTNDMVLASQGDSTVGAYSVLSYSWDMPGEANAAFVKAFEARFKRKPTFGDADNYVAYELLHAAIQKAKSTEVAAVREALAGLKAPTIYGEVEMRAADHQLVRPMVLGQVVKAGEGKGAMALRAVEPGPKVVPPPNGECKF